MAPKGMILEPGCRWRVRVTGDIQCMQPDAWDWAGIVQMTCIYAVVLATVAGLAYLLWRKHQEEVASEAVREARYNRFLELLRDVKWNLLHRNCW